jgi:hypothetical protein
VAADGGSEDFFEDTVLGIAVVQEAKPTMRVVPESYAGAGNRYYKFQVLVKLDGTEPYQVEFTQPCEAAWWLELSKDSSRPFAVRVAKTDRTKVKIAFDVDPATVTVAHGSAADILARGLDAQVVIVETEVLRPPKLNKAGDPMSRFLLTVVRADGQTPYQVNVGNGVPPNALPLVYPGSKLPAKVDPNNPNGVVIDWDTAMVAQGWAAAPAAAGVAAAAAAAAVPPPPPAAPTAIKPDWYPDPRGEKRLRYHDGTHWTDHTAD